MFQNYLKELLHVQNLVFTVFVSKGARASWGPCMRIVSFFVITCQPQSMELGFICGAQGWAAPNWTLGKGQDESPLGHHALSQGQDGWL